MPVSLMHQNRRTAMQLLAATTLAMPFASVAARADDDRVDPIGLQLYTVRDLLAQAFDRTLARVAAIGYREVEFAGYFGRTPARVRESLERAGLVAPSAHVTLQALTSELPRTLDAAHAIGHRYLVLPWLEQADRGNLDDYRRIADALNRAADAAREARIRIAYHNHDFEFVPLDDVKPYDVLLEHASADVAFELDLYWISKAGVEPALYMRRWPGRFPLVHVKDSAGAPRHEMADVGDGTLDWRRIFALHRTAGIRHYFVEHDSPTNAFASIEASYRYLRRLRF
jgi:sugar phosphate isomerase/epimerase